MNIAILDDYQGVALRLADWSSLPGRPRIDVFRDHLSDLEALVERLSPYDVVCVMRERTPLTRELIDRLPNLKLIASTGGRNASIDLDAARRHGIEVVNTGYNSAPAIELTWALILAAARHIVEENASMRGGGWQTRVGSDLRGRTLAILGLGRIGSEVARIGQAFGMKVIAWSANLTQEKAQQCGVEYVSKDDLFRTADFLTVHLVLGARTQGIVGDREIGLMKPTACLINTSRGPIVDERALIRALEENRIAGAAVDTFNAEPLPTDHPFRRLPNILATPHIGFVTEGLYRTFYEDTVSNIRQWMLVHPELAGP
jgi:phosphoglycerate dehydrogenase-like enzyme